MEMKTSMASMNENINLYEILKDCPKGTILWCLAMGTVVLTEVSKSDDFPIVVKSEDNYYHYFTKKGTLCKSEDASCILFPSKDQRDWSKWKYPKPKFDPKTLKAFDRVLARIRNGNAYCWLADFVSMPCKDSIPFIMSNGYVSMIIPYNEETKHLVGTSDEAPEYYRYWED